MSIVRITHWTCIAVLAAGLLPGAETAAVRQAQERLDQLRRLLDAGAVSRRQVEQAETALRQAKDDVLIAEHLETRIALEDLTEEQSTDAIAAAGRRLERQKERLAAQAKLVELGVAPRTSLVPFEEDVAGARRLLEAMELRARSLQEIASMIRAEQEVAETVEAPSLADGAIARITHFRGDAKFGGDEFKEIVLAFEKKFDRKLPVSARGDTALHRSMGFDHRNRVDVAVSPEGLEGRWLMRYLEQKRIPFFAFRTAVKGQATAPHIHIGPPSTRYRPSD